MPFTIDTPEGYRLFLPPNGPPQGFFGDDLSVIPTPEAEELDFGNEHEPIGYTIEGLTLSLLGLSDFTGPFVGTAALGTRTLTVTQITSDLDLSDARLVYPLATLRDGVMLFNFEDDPTLRAVRLDDEAPGVPNLEIVWESLPFVPDPVPSGYAAKFDAILGDDLYVLAGDRGFAFNPVQVEVQADALRVLRLDPETGALLSSAPLIDLPGFDLPIERIDEVYAEDIAILADGRVATVAQGAFFDQETGGDSDIQLRIYDADLSNATTVDLTAPDRGQGSFAPGIHPLDDGGYAVSFAANAPGLTIYIETYLADGTHVGGQSHPIRFARSFAAEEVLLVQPDGSVWLNNFFRGGPTQVDSLPGYGGTATLGRAIQGEDGPEVLRGTIGDDTLDGGTGDDTLEAAAGNDDLIGGAGADRLEGGAGDDRYLVDDAGDTVIEQAGDGRDEVFTFVDFTAPDDVERVKIVGGERNVRIEGGAGDDRLVGNRLDNTLVASAGEDTLTGRGGEDSFVLTQGAGRMTITDFEAGDLLLVEASLVGLTAEDTGPLTPELFRALRTEDLVGYTARSGELRIDRDDDGVREIVAYLGEGVRPDLEDVLLF